MIWGGIRPYVPDDKIGLQLKLNEPDTSYFFQFHSKNNGSEHYGRSNIYKLVLTEEIGSPKPEVAPPSSFVKPAT